MSHLRASWSSTADADDQNVQEISAATARVSPGRFVMSLLGNGVPLTLLMDLCRPDGPDSRWILAAERPDAEQVVAASVS